MVDDDLQAERDLLSILDDALNASREERVRLVEGLRASNPVAARRLSRWLEGLDEPDLLDTRQP